MKVGSAIALVAVALLTFIFAFARPKPPPPEPSYAGLTLTQLAMLNPNATTFTPTSAIARDSILRIGTNALPCLLAWLSANPEQPLKQAVRRIINAIFPNRAPFQSIHAWAASEDKALAHFEMAPYLFATLGPQGAPAIPDLERIATDARGRRSAQFAIQILAGIGIKALPALQRIAQNPKCPTSNEAAKEVALLLTNTPPK